MNPYIVNSPYNDALFNVFGIRVDLITYYLSNSILTTCVVYGTLKSLQRFISLAKPVFYSHYVNEAKTSLTCIAITIIIHIAFLPLLIFNDSKKILQINIKCLDFDIRYIYGRYLFGMAYAKRYQTSIIVQYVREYIDYVNFILSIMFDVATAIMLYKHHRKSISEWTKQKAQLEKLFLLQVTPRPVLF